MPPKHKQTRVPVCVIRKQQKKLQPALKAAEKHVGGDGGTTGINGSVSSGHNVNLFDLAGINEASIVLDPGCGLNGPCAQLLVTRGVTFTIGIEVDSGKAQRALEYTKHICSTISTKHAGASQCRFSILHADVGQIGALYPAPTHIYAFWEGWSTLSKMHLGRLFRTHLTSLKGVIFIMKAVQGSIGPEEYMWLLGFPHLKLVGKVAVNMSGSGQGFQAYVFHILVDEQKDAQYAIKYAPYLDKEKSDERKQKASTGIVRDVIQARDKEMDRANMALDLELQRPASRESGTTRTRLGKDVGRLTDLKGGILDSKGLQDAYRQITYKPLPGAAASHLLVNGNGGVFDCNMDVEVPLIRANSNNDGHAYIRIKAGGKYVYPAVRNLVALAWIPGANLVSLGLTDNFTLRSRKKVVGQLVVGHRNGNKYDNSIPNLVLHSVMVNEVELESQEQEVPRPVLLQLHDSQEGNMPPHNPVPLGVQGGLVAPEHDEPILQPVTEDNNGLVPKLGVLRDVARAAVLEAVGFSEWYTKTLSSRQAGGYHSASGNQAAQNSNAQLQLTNPISHSLAAGASEGCELHTNPTGSSLVAAAAGGKSCHTDPNSSSLVAAAGKGQSPKSHPTSGSQAATAAPTVVVPQPPSNTEHTSPIQVASKSPKRRSGSDPSSVSQSGKRQRRRESTSKAIIMVPSEAVGKRRHSHRKKKK